MPEIIIADNHEQAYPVWEQYGLKNALLTHVDFHCDMRGILIDRKNGEAFFTSERETQFIDRGNFLAHAIMNGMIADLKWIHGPRGGRAFDIGPVVRYEADYMAKRHFNNHHNSGRKAVSLKFQQGLLADWHGPRQGEILDVDWDTFASVEYDAIHREALIEQFFNCDFSHIPDLTTLIYSPGYSDPDRRLFDQFANCLADRFSANITRVPQAPLNTEGESNSALRKLVKRFAPNQVKQIKRGLSRKWRQFESAGDLDFYRKSG